MVQGKASIQTLHREAWVGGRVLPAGGPPPPLPSPAPAPDGGRAFLPSPKPGRNPAAGRAQGRGLGKSQSLSGGFRVGVGDADEGAKAPEQSGIRSSQPMQPSAAGGRHPIVISPPDPVETGSEEVTKPPECKHMSLLSTPKPT